jgi:hypothetical protein
LRKTIPVRVLQKPLDDWRHVGFASQAAMELVGPTLLDLNDSNESNDSFTSNDSQAKAHGSFKSRRCTSIPVNPAMLQAVETRNRDMEALLIEAMAKQAEVMAAGRQTKLPAEKRWQRRQRCLSMGDGALEVAVSLTRLWAKSGTADDLFRPENNEVGFVEPTSKEMVVEILCRHDAAEIEERLKRLSYRQREFTPTHAVSPRLGVVKQGRKQGTEFLECEEPLTPDTQSPMKATALPYRAAKPFQHLPKAQEAMMRYAARIRTKREKTLAWLGLS